MNLIEELEKIISHSAKEKAKDTLREILAKDISDEEKAEELFVMIAGLMKLSVEFGRLDALGTVVEKLEKATKSVNPTRMTF